ncbi:MAG: SulP family inorganic anion transporter [Anaerolineae bacterium]|nr:SulP family inorganic anion transporter [Anaerolineae bacterium]
MIIGEWITLLKQEFSGYNKNTFQKDLLAGLTVAAVALPLALAFGVASGADAAAGLVTAILAGIIIGIFSGAPYQISGPTGAMSAVLIVLASRYGLQGIWVVGILAAIMLIIMGILRLGRVVAFIPAPVITGFTSGIAIIIALGQIDNALGIKTPAAENTLLKLIYYFQHPLTPDFTAIALVLIVIATMILWPKLPFGKQIPGSLVGIILATLLSLLFGWQTPGIGSIPRSIFLDQRLQLNEIPWSEMGALIIPAMSVAALGAIESLLCGAVAGNMTGIRMRNSVELVAQGIGNLIIPFFGGVPATAAIARVSVNIKSGGVTRLSSIIHGLALMLVALVLAPIIERIPLAALAGVLMVTAWRMNEWSAIRFFFSTRLKHAIIAFLITLIATVLLDLTQAILIGFGISIIMFVAQMSDLSISHEPVDAGRMNAAGYTEFIHPGHDIHVYYVSGPLFFAAARKLLEETRIHQQNMIILSLRGVPLVDATGIEVLRELWHQQQKAGGDLLLAALQPKVELLLDRSGFLDEIGREHIFWSADRAILSLGIDPTDIQPHQTAKSANNGMSVSFTNGQSPA